MVFIQEILADEHAYDIYEIIRGNYAHFIYIPPIAALDLLENPCQGGMLIASKYGMEQTQFNTFQEDVSDGNEGFFDFVLKNADRSLGHVYATNLRSDAADEAITLKFMQIMEKIHDDILKVEEESIPFVLCGDLNSLQSSRESKRIINSYFGPEDYNSCSNCTLLLQSSPDFSRNTDLGHIILSSTKAIGGGRTGLHTLVKGINSHFIGPDINSILNYQQLLVAQKTDTLMKKKLETLPVKSNKDKDKGGGSAEVGVKRSWGGKDGPKTSIYGKGEVHDNKGNYLKGQVEQNSDGKGKADVSAGHETKKK